MPNIRIVTENAAFARRVYSILRKLYGVNPEIVIRRSRKLKKHLSFIIVLTGSMGTLKILDDMGIRMKADVYSGDILDVRPPDVYIKKGCCRRAYIRGAFLAGGSISDPEKSYHLEITTHSLSMAQEIDKLIKGYKLNSKIIRRKGNYVIYLKEGENIVDFLNIIGAHTALLELENVRILKEMRNNVNRIVNCETANLGKTVDASIRQIENIEYIRDVIGFGSLPENLREVAELRLKHNDANLKELGEMLSPPLGKSGVNHRLRKLDNIAEGIRSNKK
jgi:DNA-binding protein WhiA